MDKRKAVCLVAKQYENAYLSGKIMITCLYQCFPAISLINSFQPQSFKLVSLNVLFIEYTASSFFVCIDIIAMEVRKLSDVLGPQVEKELILSKGGSY